MSSADYDLIQVFLMTEESSLPLQQSEPVTHIIQEIPLEGYEDVDVGIYLEADENSSGNCTPTDTDSLNPSLVDSGFNEGLNLHCLETVLEWRLKKSSCHQCTPNFRFKSLDNRGFEDYVEDIYFHRLGIEYKYQVTMCLENQPEVTPGIRGLLVTWMTRIHHQLSLCQDTLFIAVNIVDRILDVMQASRDYLQLLGVTTILLASKLEEIHPPEIVELLSLCDGVFTRAQVKYLEHVVLKAINFDLLVPTSQYFLEYFASHVISLHSGYEADKLRQARGFARCILELSLQDYELSQIRGSMLAYSVWKVALDNTASLDCGYMPPGLCFTEEYYQYVYKEVKNFTDTLKQSFPDLDSICEHYFNLYGVE